MDMKKITILLLLLITAFQASANKRASEIYMDLLKFQSLKRVLYIAAHPDDENTRFLAYMSLGEKAETAYMSLTRGDGGQNLIGDEYSEKLGVLRTQELLAARNYDGANQFKYDATHFFNAFVSLDGESWSVGVFGRNLSDERIPTWFGVDAGGPGVHQFFQNLPRRYGVELRKRF